MAKKKYTDWSDLDLINLLRNNGISCSETGKNIGSGYFGIENCPFCDAPGNHFGIRFDTNVGTCFVCGESAAPPRIVKETLGIEWREVYSLLDEHSDKDRFIPEALAHGSNVILPDGVDHLNPQAADYLIDRNYPLLEILKKYKIKSTAGESYLEIENSRWDFSYRIIIPIYMEKKLVAYTGRTYIDHEVRYMNSPTPACLIPPASCIYNIDTVKDKGIFVEGLTDVWRLGDSSAGIMGVKFTKEQIAYIGSKKLDEAYVLFDAGAAERAREFSVALSSFVPKVEVITLNTSDDPGNLLPDEALKIKYKLLGRI